MAKTVLSVAAPVKLESLQVLSAMSRNYFELLMVSHMNNVTKALQMSFTDKYTDLRLHAGRAVDFIGQAINSYISNEGNNYLTCFLLIYPQLFLS